MINSEGEIRILNHDGQIITILKDEIRTINHEGYIITTKPKDETAVDLSTSCNKAVAVAKLLGWMKGSIFPKVMVAIPNDNGEIYIDLLRILDEDENSLQEMLSHMRDVTSQELAAAKSDATSDELKEKGEAVANIDSLINKASMYLLDINEELSKGEDSAIKTDPQRSEEKGITHITLRSLDQWAKENHHISFDIVTPSTNREVPFDVTWDDIEIRIRKGNKLAYSHEKGNWTEKTFGEIGLLDKRTQQPNHLAGILIGLSIGDKFPPTGTADNKYKVAIHRLSKSLKTLTSIESEPFTEFNKTHGWKPRFKLTDSRKNADDRAKKAAMHEQYNEGKDYDDEDDDAGKFLRGE